MKVHEDDTEKVTQTVTEPQKALISDVLLQKAVPYT